MYVRFTPYALQRVGQWKGDVFRGELAVNQVIYMSLNRVVAFTQAEETRSC